MIKIEFVIPGNIKSKKNSKKIIPIQTKRQSSWKFYYAKRGLCDIFPTIVPSTAHKKWDKESRDYITEIMADLFNRRIIKHLNEKDVWVSAKIYYKGPEPDLSGCLESIGDLLQPDIIKDDKQIRSWDGSRTYHDKKNPRIELVIGEYNEE